MPKVTVAGGEIYYEEAGQGHPLVFISGLNGVGRYWEPQVPVFRPHYRVVTYDQRGTGASDRLQRKFSVDQMAAETVGLMDVLKIGPAHIVGMSPAARSARYSRSIIRSAWHGSRCAARGRTAIPGSGGSSKRAARCTSSAGQSCTPCSIPSFSIHPTT